MKKTMEIDTGLLARARQAARAASDTETVRLGLESLLREQACRQLIALTGTEPDARDVPRRRLGRDDVPQ